MTYYYNASRSEVRQMDPAFYAGWVSAGNPKAAQWALIPDPPADAKYYDGAQWVVTTLAEAKAARISAINAEAQQRILAQWPDWAQRNVALGVYGEPEATACRDWIADHITASNAASDLVTAATTVDAVNAVIVNWPA